MGVSSSREKLSSKGSSVLPLEVSFRVRWRGAQSRPALCIYLHELQPSRLPCPWDFQAGILEWVSISFSTLSH